MFYLFILMIFSRQNTDLYKKKFRITNKKSFKPSPWSIPGNPFKPIPLGNENIQNYDDCEYKHFYSKNTFI